MSLVQTPIQPEDSVMMHKSFNLIESFPLELLPRLLLKLDCFSLRSLLEAYPQVARQCVVIVEQPDFYQQRQTYFFSDCKELDIIYVPEYNPKIHRRYMFRIYDVTYRLASRDCGRKLTSSRMKKNLPYISKTNSIVYYFPTGQLMQSVESAFQHSLIICLLKEGIALQICPPMGKEAALYSVDDPFLTIAPPVPIDFSTPDLIRVHLQGIETIRGLTFQSRLSRITIIFNSSQQAPLMKDLTFTCVGISLSIYYDDKVPFMENLVFSCASQCVFNSVLVLGHLPSLEANLTSALPTHPDEGKDFGYLSMLFPQGDLDPRFLTLKVIGGPTGIMEYFGKSCALGGLEWKQTCTPIDNREVVFHHQYVMTHFTFETLVKGAKCPTIVNFSDCFVFDSLNIRSYHGLDLSGIEHRLPKEIKVVNIHVETSDASDYVSSIAGIWSNLVKDESICLYSINIVGLKASSTVTRSEIDRMVSRTSSKQSEVVLI